MNHLKFEDLPKAMEIALQKLTLLEDELAALKDNFQPIEPNELMTRIEVADYFKIDISTVWNWTKKGILTSYGIGSRVYYKRKEIESNLTKLG